MADDIQFIAAVTAPVAAPIAAPIPLPKPGTTEPKAAPPAAIVPIVDMAPTPLLNPLLPVASSSLSAADPTYEIPRPAIKFFSVLDDSLVAFVESLVAYAFSFLALASSSVAEDNFSTREPNSIKFFIALSFASESISIAFLALVNAEKISCASSVAFIQ